MRSSAERYRMSSEPGEIMQANYLRLDNTHMSADEAARTIKERFGL